MSAAITAIAISTAAMIYNAEEQRKVQSKADEAVKINKITANNEMAWQQKKKGIADTTAANNALRLRGTPGDTSAPGFIPGSTGAPSGAMGILGGVGGQQPGTTNKMSSPLGL